MKKKTLEKCKTIKQMMNSIADKKEKRKPELIGDRAFQTMINGASGVYEKETGRERG